MAKTVEYHNPDFEDGVIFDVGGLRIPNGGSIELDEDAELSFFAKKQTSVSDYFADDKMVKVSGKSELTKSVMNAHTASKVDAEPAPLDDVVADEPVDVPTTETEE
jgi:hypothetical protein